MIETGKIPKLGFGLMRLPTRGSDSDIDIEKVCDMVDLYMKAGLNYFDSAYVYHGGASEKAIKAAIVDRYPRDSFYLATKLPAWCLTSEADRERIFNEQLERTGAGYFDFYLLHSIEEGNNYDTYERLSCFDFCVQKKKEGLIRHFGFSFHGSPELLEKMLDKHPEVEFVQIQLNYLDWENPVIRSGQLYEILRTRNIPIIVMEPVKGGSLASVQPEIEEKLKVLQPDRSVASWALRFVASLHGVITVLSGMSTDEQMKDNLGTFSPFEPLSEKERQALSEVVKIMTDYPMIGCTSCRYCCDGCPQSISIPDVFRAMNTISMYPDSDISRAKNFYNSVIQDGGKASDCIACGQCESICPQHLPIIELMKDAAEKLDV